MFQVLTGENWNEVVYNGMVVDSVTAALYFTLLNVVGNYMILNLFLAILLDEFENGEDDDEEEEEEKEEGGEEDGGEKDGEVKLQDPPGVAFGILAPDNGLRRAMFDLQSHWLFDNFILFLIGLSTFLLAFDEPVYQRCMCFAKDFEAAGLTPAQYTQTDLWTGEDYGLPCSTYGDGTYFFSFKSTMSLIGTIIAVFFMM